MAKGRPDFSPTAVDVVLRPEWAALSSTDKNISGQAINVDGLTAAKIDYTIPVGKTLYICGISFASHATAVANADLNQMSYLYCLDLTASIYFSFLGGNGGGHITFSKPIPIPSAHVLRIYLWNMSSHNGNLYISMQGYEV